MSINYKKIIFINILILIIGLFSFNKTYQHALPYYISASNNYSFGEMPKYNSEEIKIFNDGNSGVYSVSKGLYTFSNNPKLHTKSEIIDHFGYAFSHGFVIYIKICRFFFGWLGDLNSLIITNFLIHIIIFNFVYFSINDRYEKLFFIMLFGMNPLLLKLATFPYYYYPVSLISGVVFFIKDKKNSLIIPGLIVSIILSLIRITILPLLIFAILRIKKIKINIIFIPLIISIYLYLNKFTYGYYDPYYTAITGIGAYSNHYGFYLSDQYTLNFLNNLKSDGGYIYNGIYYYSDMAVLKEYFFNLLKLDIFLYINTVIKNFFILFGFGYNVESSIYNKIALLMGFFHVVYLLYYKEYEIFFLIVASALGVIIFFPPIPAYIAPSYVFLSYSFAKICSQIIRKTSLYYYV